MADEKRFRRSSSARVQEFYALADKLQSERMVAPALVETALRETPSGSWHTLVTRTSLLNHGAAEHVEKLASQEISRSPRQAEALARLAVSMAAALPDTAYPPVILALGRAVAWKTLGNALSTLARYAEAIDAYANAENEIDDFASVSYDRAVIRLNLAITYLDTGRFSEASEILEECKQVFQGHGDMNLVVLASFYEGVALQQMKRYRQARETYLLLMTSATDIKKSTVAALHQTIGICSREIGDFVAAETHLQKAIALHKELGQPLDALKGEHARGILLIRQGHLNQGIAHLRTVRHQYLKASLAEEAGLCALEIVDALLRARDPEAAEALARTIMNEFLAASLSAHAITALSYLSEAISERRASPALAMDVHRYVLSLRTDPEREFLQADA